MKRIFKSDNNFVTKIARRYSRYIRQNDAGTRIKCPNCGRIVTIVSIDSKCTGK